MHLDRKLRKTFLPTLLCLLGMLVAACGGGTVPNGNGNGSGNGHPTPAPASQQILRFYGFDAPVTDIATFDPGQASDSESINAIEMVYTGLVELDDNLKIQPQLASSYDKSADGLT